MQTNLRNLYTLKHYDSRAAKSRVLRSSSVVVRRAVWYSPDRMGRANVRLKFEIDHVTADLGRRLL
jgi:hypothetical protein